MKISIMALFCLFSGMAYTQPRPAVLEVTKRKAVIGGKDSAVYAVYLQLSKTEDDTIRWLIPEYGSFRANQPIQFISVRKKVTVYPMVSFDSEADEVSTLSGKKGHTLLFSDIAETLGPNDFEMPAKYPDTYLEDTIANPAEFETKFHNVLNNYFTRGYVRDMDYEPLIAYRCNYIPVGNTDKFNMEASVKITYGMKRNKTNFYRIYFVSRMNRRGDRNWESPGNPDTIAKTKELVESVRNQLNH